MTENLEVRIVKGYYTLLSPVPWQILENALQSLGLLLHQYRDAEDLVEPGMTHLDTQNAEDRIPLLFQKLWDRRHDLLPLPLDARFPRKLKQEHECATAVDKLELTIVQGITDYESAFGSSVPNSNPLNEQKLYVSCSASNNPTNKYSASPIYPKITFEGALLSIHC